MEKVSGFEKFAYSMGAFGQNFAYAIMSSYLMFFYTDSFGMATAAVSTLFFVARIWDAVLDPLIGLLVDRSNLRYGKFRPFILIGGILAGLFTILCFFNPTFGFAGKMIYAYITYIIWGTTYGLMDVPYWSMSPSMTTDPAERTKIVSIPKITATIATLLVSALTIPLVKAIGNGNDSKGYFGTALIYGIICACGAIIASLWTKERIKTEKKQDEKFIDSAYVVFKNKPLILLLLMNIMTGSALMIKQTIVNYYFKYNVGNEYLIPYFALAGLVPMLIAMVLAPSVSNKIGKKKTAIWGGIIGAVFSAAIYYVSGNLVLLFVFNSLSLLGNGVMMVLTMAMMADTVEYAEWKTGKRSESIIFSFGTFTNKLSGAIGGMLAGAWLTLVGYVANVPQSEAALNGINMMLSWAPAIGLLLMSVIMFFYDLTEERHAEIMKELGARKSNVENTNK